MRNFIKLFSVIVLTAVIGFTMTACPPDGGPEPGTAEYKGTANGKTYTLKITENTGRAAYTPKAGDRYELTVDTKKSTGTVESYSNNNEFKLKPSNAGTETFYIYVSTSGITGISGTITFDDKSTDDSAKTAPITVTPQSPSTGDNGGNTNNTTDEGITEVAKDVQVNIGSIDTSTALVFDKIKIRDNNTNQYVLHSIVDYVPGTTITVKDGKLNMKLGTPKTEYVQTIDSLTPLPPGVTMDPGDTEAFVFNGDFYTSNGSYELYAGPNYVSLFYATKDGTVIGSNNDYGLTFDMSFKKGWNYEIQERDQTTGNSTTVTAAQTLPSGYNWVIEASH